jgi:hypothetical protein
MALLIASSTLAAQTLFYQPLLKDLKQFDCPKVCSIVKAKGYDQIIVQWSRYGTTDFWQNGWLPKVAETANNQAIGLVVGLYGDPGYFKRIESFDPSAIHWVDHYFATLRKHHLAVAETVIRNLKKTNLSGWYLPEEIDDLHFRESALFHALLKHLRSIKQSLQAIQPLPIHISAFFGGYMSPEAFAERVAQIESMGIRVWLQTGVGAGLADPVESELYLKAIARHGACRVVVENFVQDRQKGFIPMPQALLKEEEAHIPHHCDRAIFSLRYLPEINKVAKNADMVSKETKR